MAHSNIGTWHCIEKVASHIVTLSHQYKPLTKPTSRTLFTPLIIIIMLFSKVALATATAVASIKGVTAKKGKGKGKSADLSGVGFDVLHINPGATSVINGGTYDASNIVAAGTGSSIYDGAYGLFVDTDATATVCDAKLIKGGTQIEGETYGRGGVFVASGATLNIVDGLVEGGDEPDTESLFFGNGIYASYENPEANHIVITGGEILGGLRKDKGRGPSIFVEGGGTIDVYGGTIGDKHTSTSLEAYVGYAGDLPAGNNVAVVNIHGGDWKGNLIIFDAANNAEAYLHIYGEDLQVQTLDENGKEFLVEGHLCDGSFFQQTIHAYTNNSNALTVSNDCSGSTAPTFDECGSGKGKKKSKGVRGL
jgi:hypothetical protein